MMFWEERKLGLMLIKPRVCLQSSFSKFLLLILSVNCPECNFESSYFYQLQIRSADEPMSSCTSFFSDTCATVAHPFVSSSVCYAFFVVQPNRDSDIQLCPSRLWSPVARELNACYTTHPWYLMKMIVVNGGWYSLVWMMQKCSSSIVAVRWYYWRGFRSVLNSLSCYSTDNHWSLSMRNWNPIN